ncbi:MAG: hypothetical protein RIB46_01235 [Pseudomonadales bacterium]
MRDIFDAKRRAIGIARDLGIDFEVVDSLSAWALARYATGETSDQDMRRLLFARSNPVARCRRPRPHNQFQTRRHSGAQYATQRRARR